jgi:hypothetical protein
MYFSYKGFLFKELSFELLFIPSPTTYIEKFLKLANFYGSSYYFLKTLFMYHTYRIQTKNATEMTFVNPFEYMYVHFVKD